MSALHNARKVYRAVAAIIVKRAPIAASASCLDEIHSLTRKPLEDVYLLVKKPRKHHAWQFPQGGIDQGETLSEAALRELKEECGQGIRVQLTDTTRPFFEYQYDFPEAFIRNRSFKDDSTGAKVMFLRAMWLSGQCEPDLQEIVDFAWLTRKEMEDYVSPEYRPVLEALDN